MAAIQIHHYDSPCWISNSTYGFSRTVFPSSYDGNLLLSSHDIKRLQSDSLFPPGQVLFGLSSAKLGLVTGPSLNTQHSTLACRVGKTWNHGKQVSGTNGCFQEQSVSQGCNIQESVKLFSHNSKQDGI